MTLSNESSGTNSLSHQSLFAVCFFWSCFLSENSNQLSFLWSFQFYFVSIQFFFSCLIWSETLDSGLDFFLSLTTVPWFTQDATGICCLTLSPICHPAWQIWFPDSGPAHPPSCSPWLTWIYISICTYSTCVLCINHHRLKWNFVKWHTATSWS